VKPRPGARHWLAAALHACAAFHRADHPEGSLGEANRRGAAWIYVRLLRDESPETQDYDCD